MTKTTENTIEKLAIELIEHLSFEQETDLYYSKINANQTQIRTLEKMRDTLLPKLMSGEVRVELPEELR